MPYDELVKAITSGLSQFRWIADSVDIIIIAVLLYRLIVLTKETRAYQVLKGIGVLFLAAILSDALQLQTVSWMLNSIVASGIIVMVVLFQPELRRAFEHIGRGELFTKNLFNEVHLEEAQIVAELQQAILNLSKRRVGALIVIELKTGLADIVSTGTRIEGVISAPLIENIFEPNTPLHDGAVIICDGRIVAAGCFLPLSEEFSVARELGTRHRAALGVSGVSDSVTLIVSEETGVISFARDGKLVRYIDQKALKNLLESIFVTRAEGSFSLLKRRNRNDK
ncbi:MAG: DNA integrity scanning protein DisA [Firmicutes bacterium ADurb.Bin248]|nr:MAG: DNA integrity scanning protein DisA [Firmicutes bacterium ADurb.Bin248]HOF99486.1 diadenylate cyclase CdaA [Clostridia bacterium]HPK15179.1 diadenylate cyclase CdaA [Clostridia bacterium]